MRTLLTSLVALAAILLPTVPAHPLVDDPVGPAPARDLTMELRDAYLGLGDAWSTNARGHRAATPRPSDTASGSSEFTWDPAAPRARSCGTSVCVHYVTTTKDAPPMASSDGVTPDWVHRNVEVAEQSLAKMLSLGYPAPPSDGGRGGTAQFDIYLADISGAGLYGYCTPEAPVPGVPGHASSYCVLDNDFVGFPKPPDASLRVTAAHELFHAVQFGMDVREDRWFLEATATWMEEQVADDVNDNRQFLADGQLGDRRTPLDASAAGLSSYGNWIFFQFLAQRYGVSAVRHIWAQADAGIGHHNAFSIQAVRRYVDSRRANFPRVYAAFAVANLNPRRAYDEGAAYRAARPDQTVRLGRGRRTWRDGALGVPHLSARAVAFKPRPGLRGKARLRIKVDARLRVGAATSTMVFLKSGRVARTTLRLDKRGRGKRVVSFSRSRVRRVVVVLTNASMRYDCGRRTQFSCRGVPRDDDQRFELKTTVINRR